MRRQYSAYVIQRGTDEAVSRLVDIDPKQAREAGRAHVHVDADREALLRERDRVVRVLVGLAVGRVLGHAGRVARQAETAARVGVFASPTTSNSP